MLTRARGAIVQVVILAGGFGTRLSEETDIIPKPMVRIGNVPILRHIMNYYSKFGHTDFIIALGYKADVIQDYFLGVAKKEPALGWNINLVDTGLDTATGGRLKRLEGLLEKKFLMTYGDGLSNVNLEALIEFHESSGRLATLTAVLPPPRFGTISIDRGIVTNFSEKNPNHVDWISGGFFCLEREICEYINGDETSFENHSLTKLVEDGQLGAFQHNGWWQPMDTLRDKRNLETIWNSSAAPWIME